MKAMRVRHVCAALVLSTAGVVTLGGTAAAAPTAIGQVVFLITSSFAEGGAGPVTVSGVINDTGVDTQLSPTEDVFDFGARGKVHVFHAALSESSNFNQRKCTFTFTERGTYVFGNGTGEWANYNGSGKYVVKGVGVNACDDQEPVGPITITAHGPVNDISEQLSE